jgi:hypothetical protein
MLVLGRDQLNGGDAHRSGRLTSQSEGIPWRGPGPGRPDRLPLPPARMPLVRGGRPLKAWGYIGVYGPDLMLCAGSVRVGPTRQAFWAVWDEAAGRLSERTRMLRTGAVAVDARGVRVRDDGVAIDLAVGDGAPIEVVSPHGDQYAWTRKRGGVPVRGHAVLDGRVHEIDGRAVVDESAGYHARATAWEWSAGVGTTGDGRAVAWNLVTGLHDAPVASERTVWLDGAPEEVGPVRFAPDLDGIVGAAGETLRFEQRAERRRDDDLLLLRSTYRQPFGRFTGTLPGGVALAEGFGVMERHEARW